MNKSADSASAAHSPAQGVTRQPAYSQDARHYDHRTSAFQAYRQAIVGALPVRPACPPGEWHDLALMIFGVTLNRHGWRIDYLGVDTPVEEHRWSRSLLPPLYDRTVSGWWPATPACRAGPCSSSGAACRTGAAADSSSIASLVDCIAGFQETGLKR